MAKRKKTTLGVVHVTATSPKMKLTNASLRAMHAARGFSDIGYNEWISRDGTLNTGRGADEIGAHVAGFNSISYGISLEGGIDLNGKGDISTITPAQWKTLERRVKEISQKYPGIKWCGHRDLSPDKDGDGVIEPYEYIKECPCFDVIPWAENLSLKGADIKGTWKTITSPESGKPIFEGPDTRIAYLQRLLTKAGFAVGDDGILGDKTAAAIKQFQKVCMLPQNGKFDDATVRALREAIELRNVTPATGTVAQTEPVKQETVEIPLIVQKDVPTKVGEITVSSAPPAQPVSKTTLSKSGVTALGAAIVSLVGLIAKYFAG